MDSTAATGPRSSTEVKVESRVGFYYGLFACPAQTDVFVLFYSAFMLTRRFCGMSAVDAAIYHSYDVTSSSRLRLDVEYACL